MNVAGLPLGLVVVMLAGTMLVSLFVCLIAMTRIPYERRAAFGRFLGHAFMVLLVLSIIAGMVVQARG